MTFIVNLFAGPGAGKSTIAAGVFHELKKMDVNAELVTEVAKDLTWEERHMAIGVQSYVFGKQYMRLNRLIRKVDVIVTDSPILLSAIYGRNEPDSFRKAVVDYFKVFDNKNYLIQRNKRYNSIGRNQSEQEAYAIDKQIEIMLNNNGFLYKSVDYVYAVHDIVNLTLLDLKRDKT